MKKKELLYISIGIFLTVIAWLVADIHHAATEEKIKVKIEIPKLDNYKISKELLDVVKEKNE
ncbi:hypothetical protein B6D29_04505 [Microgenomates bacterium UTCPR1]|nr:hypothetical protein [Patescibacteria group bacterium]OQY65034.1 MAG: hypothetical protein B6D29_04505 [Microgenomates bacterium UTCPR1]